MRHSIPYRQPEEFLAFYQFKDTANPKALQNIINETYSSKLLGTIILAKEGINGSIMGNSENVKKFITTLKKNGFCNLTMNQYLSRNEAFDRFVVKIKNEIVTSNFKAPKSKMSFYIEPDRWDEEIVKPNMTVLDVRNFYESKIGSFLNAIKPKTRSFKEFKDFITIRLADHPKDKPIAMFCTGGIRCEKAADFLNSIGFSSIYKLNGGILGYFKKNKTKKSLWTGDCFVFDKRVAINRNFVKMKYQQCYGCKTIITHDTFLLSSEEWTLCLKCKETRNNDD